MASNEIPTANDNNINNINEERKTVKKAVVAYRPASKAKKSFNKTQYLINKSNKSPEDLQDEVLQLKKSLMTTSEENSILKAKIRRTEEENIKKDKQIMNFLDPNQSEELRRLLIDKKSSANTTINNLKQRIIKLELSLKEKEQTLKKLQSDLKATKAKEMKIQLDTCFQEITRLKNLNQKKNNSSPPKPDLAGKSDISNTSNEMKMKKRPDAIYDSKLYSEKKKLEEKLKQISEELRSYQKLAENRETEVKSLRSTIANLQRTSEKDVTIRQSSSSRTQPSSTGSDTTGPTNRGSSAPVRSSKTPNSPHDAFTMSSTVRKMSSKAMQVRKTGSNLASPKEDKAEMTKLAGKRSLNKLELDLTRVTPSLDNRRVLSARSTINKSSCANDNDQWVMQATVKKVVDKSKGESSGYDECKSKAAGDSHRDVDLRHVEFFRQNCAARKIQKGWKNHARYVDETRNGKLREILNNRAARIIQKGWKKHQSFKQNVNERHNDDDDVVC